MRYPPRLAHLATRGVVAAKLAPTYGISHQVDDEEALMRLTRALGGPLLDDLLATAWAELVATKKKLTDEELLERVAKALKDRPLRPGKVAETNPAWSAFLVRIDVDAGLASDSARRVLESEAAAKMVGQGLIQAGKHLATELLRK
jgi:hypothetical protein